MSRTSRGLDRQFQELRDLLDRQILQANAIARVRDGVLQATAAPLAGFDWRRLAAGLIFAVVLGGAADLMLPDSASEPSEIAILDPLDLESGAQE